MSALNPMALASFAFQGKPLPILLFSSSGWKTVDSSQNNLAEGLKTFETLSKMVQRGEFTFSSLPKRNFTPFALSLADQYRLLQDLQNRERAQQYSLITAMQKIYEIILDFFGISISLENHYTVIENRIADEARSRLVKRWMKANLPTSSSSEEILEKLQQINAPHLQFLFSWSIGTKTLTSEELSELAIKSNDGLLIHLLIKRNILPFPDKEKMRAFWQKTASHMAQNVVIALECEGISIPEDIDTTWMVPVTAQRGSIHDLKALTRNPKRFSFCLKSKSFDGETYQTTPDPVKQNLLFHAHVTEKLQKKNSPNEIQQLIQEAFRLPSPSAIECLSAHLPKREDLFNLPIFREIEVVSFFDRLLTIMQSSEYTMDPKKILIESDQTTWQNLIGKMIGKLCKENQEAGNRQFMRFIRVLYPNLPENVLQEMFSKIRSPVPERKEQPK